MTENENTTTELEPEVLTRKDIVIGQLKRVAPFAAVAAVVIGVAAFVRSRSGDDEDVEIFIDDTI
jgi:hypothetical protein